MASTDPLTTGALTDELDDWWADFERSLRRRGRSTDTISRYRASFIRFWRWALHAGGVTADVEDVTRADLHRWLDHMRAEDLADGTVAINWRNLRPFFSWLARETETISPFDGADNPAEHAEIPDVLPLDDIRALIKTCSGRDFTSRRDATLIRVFVDTGVRVGEAVSIGAGDWDRRSDLLTVVGKRRLRVVPLSAATGEHMARYLRTRARHRLAERHDGMWLGRKGPLTASGIEQMLARRSAQAGLTRVYPHQLRHSFAHYFRDAGGSEGDLMYLAGWSSTTMAHRYGRSAAEARAQRAHRQLGLGDQL